MKSIEDRFWPKVDVLGPDECWNWKAYKNKSGHGRFGKDGKVSYAYRVSYEIHFGPIDNNLFVCHKCDNPSCVNPNHLFLGTNKDNLADMASKGRSARQYGSSNGNSKITEEDVVQIRKLLLEGNLKQKEIAELYGVTQSHISLIGRGGSWSHVT